MKKIGTIKYAAIAIAIIGFVSWDLFTTGSVMVSTPLYRSLSLIDSTKSVPTTVSIVGSDLTSLSSPVSLATELTEVQIDSMVCKALDLQGSAVKLFTPGKKILIKPNIVEYAVNGRGDNTDTRVVKALVKYIHKKTGGNCTILIGEGSPRPTKYETKLSHQTTTAKWTTALWDLTGYPTLLTELRNLGISEVDTVNLNGGATTIANRMVNLREVSIRNGGYAIPQGGKYWIHKDIVTADVYIAVPVLKVHNPGITCALKDQIGIAPGNRYGMNKQKGVDADGDAYYLSHNMDAPRDWTDEEIVDLSLAAGIDLVVVDATMCLERQKTYASGNQVRMNTILVGNDPVAVDNVSARMIGFNPDDVDHIALAEMVGMGTNKSELITTVGSALTHVAQQFKKLSSDARCIFGQSNRKWLVSQAYTVGSVSDPINYAFIANEASYVPVAGTNGWSLPMYFFDDRIDLGNYFNYPTSSVVAYVFAYVYAPVAKTAELWTGCDEPLKVYLNNIAVYNSNSTQTYGTGELQNATTTITLQQGYNTLMVKALQKVTTGTFDFALNICEPATDVELSGHRVSGLKFMPVLGNQTGVNVAKSNKGILKAYPNPASEYTSIDIAISKNQKCIINVYDLGGKFVCRLLSKSLSAGTETITWNLKDNKGNQVSAGHYIVKEEISGQMVKVIVVK